MYEWKPCTVTVQTIGIGISGCSPWSASSSCRAVLSFFCGRGERSFAKLRRFAVMPKGIKKILTLAGVSIFCTRGKAPPTPPLTPPKGRGNLKGGDHEMEG